MKVNWRKGLSKMSLFKILEDKKKIEINDESHSSFTSTKIIENNDQRESFKERFYVIVEKSKKRFFDYREGKEIEYNLTFEEEFNNWSSSTTLYYFNNGKSVGIKRIRANNGGYASELENFSKINSEKINYFKPLVKALEINLNKKLISDETWKEITSK